MSGGSIPSGSTPRRRALPADAFLQLGLAILAVAAWEIVARAFGTDFWTSSPSAVAAELGRWAASGQLAVDLQLTLTEAGVGFVIGSVAGGLIGFILGWMTRLGDLFEPFILSLYTLPKIALAPLFVLWFGIGATNKIMFAAMLVFFMVFFTTYQGTRQVDRDLVENARLLGAGKWDIWTKIAIPYSAVWIFTGIRIGLPYALIGAIVGEFVAAEAGVGFRIKEATSFFNTAAVFAGLIVLMCISLVLLGLLKLLESRALAWQSAGNRVSAGDPT
ncbi:ABC transporter permease [Chelatococcus asaccharovorans]|uniref:NitT/TauT family transport system permease protein n=1 Tax=Chelatococcus asaccharovorans TaxID=28210 RepID=A0A2V3TQN6_9HYPH|nr:ABC transporter permease [Chelatococcus asaccharovorans]MBS7706900.1 ABC transporter permease [Chelatococcus asaccharovorans]PXW50561.1 NitT/TauT family transport system permease protein [Chelatococcus asaccharovorans]